METETKKESAVSCYKRLRHEKSALDVKLRVAKDAASKELAEIELAKKAIKLGLLKKPAASA